MPPSRPRRRDEPWPAGARTAAAADRTGAALALTLGLEGGALDGLRDLAEQVHELDLREVQGLDLQVGHDAALQRFELHPLGVGDREAGLFLAGERLELAVELGQQPARLRVTRYRALRVPVARDRRVLRHELTHLLGLVHDLLRFDGHVFLPGWTRYYSSTPTAGKRWKSPRAVAAPSSGWRRQTFLWWDRHSCLSLLSGGTGIPAYGPTDIPVCRSASCSG